MRGLQRLTAWDSLVVPQGAIVSNYVFCPHAETFNFLETLRFSNLWTKHVIAKRLLPEEKHGYHKRFAARGSIVQRTVWNSIVYHWEAIVSRLRVWPTGWKTQMCEKVEFVHSVGETCNWRANAPIEKLCNLNLLSSQWGHERWVFQSVG